MATYQQLQDQVSKLERENSKLKSQVDKFRHANQKILSDHNKIVKKLEKKIKKLKQGPTKQSSNDKKSKSFDNVLPLLTDIFDESNYEVFIRFLDQKIEKLPLTERLKFVRSLEKSNRFKEFKNKYANRR